MSAYLFVHFKEKRTPDGEQVYFGISRDGFHYEQVNDGMPVLWSYQGDCGVRDFTITRTKEGKFVILATDLSLAYGMPGKYQHSWANISRFGSKCLVMWTSDDLIHWSDQKMIPMGGAEFGCVWAPDIIYDREEGNYVVHWSSSHESTGFGQKRIYYSRTADFVHFTPARELFCRLESVQKGVIDSAIYYENGHYYLFVKSEGQPGHVFLYRAEHVTGPYEEIPAFSRCMEALEEGVYEAPTAFRTQDGRWALFLDHYGMEESRQGYVPFLSEDIDKGEFVPASADFSFPYGFKHGTILEITDEEYERLKHYHKSPSER